VIHNGKAIREVCREFVALCRKLGLLGAARVAIDGFVTLRLPNVCSYKKLHWGLVFEPR
jgi:hypothetical protein